MASLTEQRATALKAAQDVVANAKNGDLTNSEVATIQGHVDEIKVLDAQIVKAEKSADLIRRIGEVPDDYTHGAGSSAKGRLSLRTGTFGNSIKAGMTDGIKGLVATGATVVEVPILGGIQLADRAPLSFLEAFDTVKRDSPAYRFLRETTRTNNAAVVAPGATKPTSVFTITPVDARLRVIAHLSEPMDKYLLQDAGNLDQFVHAELVDGLQYALESETLSGDGTGEHFTGLANTTGIQTTTGTDLLTNLRTAITAVETISSTPRFFAVNPTDWATIETTRNTSGNFDFGSPAAAVNRAAWGVPVVTTPALAAGTSYLVSEGAAVISTDGRISVDWGTPGDTFTKNQLVARVEGRFGLDVLRPSGVVKITTTAA